MESLNNWLEKNLIDFTFIKDKKFIKVNEKIFYILESKLIDSEFKLFDEDFNFILSNDDYFYLDNNEVDYFLFSFGQKFYYSSLEKTELNLFKYFGLAKQTLKLDYTFLGVHTGYELCNGSRLAEDWIKKAKFLEINKLGICELNTLAGTLKFQEECLKQDIYSIIGETIFVKPNEGEIYELKLFVKDQIGWKNLLNINSQINVFNEQFVTEEFLLNHIGGLVVVIGCSKKLDLKFIKLFKEKIWDDDLFFQIDLVEYSSNEKDKEHLLNLQHYFQNFQGKINPILLCDSYYLDQEDYEIKYLLNKIGKVGFKYQSKNQYFKPLHDLGQQFEQLFNKSYRKIFEMSLKASNDVYELCKDFKIITTQKFLPKYEQTVEEKQLGFEDNEDLLWNLIENGFEKKIEGKVNNEQVYIDRIESEVAVIKKGNIVDYFLILYDIIRYCKQNNILVGVGRGSSAGSLIAYLLGIVELDPIKYDLLFERFLNEARLTSELPDIDTDFESARRDDVKRYMESRYGVDFVASVGTFSYFKNKSVLKDLGRELSLNYSELNFITSIINKEAENGDLIDLFKNSLGEFKLKEFLTNNIELINNLQLILHQPKTQSIHASATIIVPKKDNEGNNKNIYDWMPVKKVNGVLITEWEGKVCEKAGFLKEDILGILQLDKFRAILDLIKINFDLEIDYTQLNTGDKNVYDLFHKGYNEDVFQFTTDSLKAYCRYLKPDNLEELIAANALHRPGPMESSANIDFVKIKFGEKKAKYDYLLEHITKSTFGLYCFQEQVMKAFQTITDSDLKEADLFRKIITKADDGYKNDENINNYRKIFVDKYIEKGCNHDGAEEVFEKLIAFSKYAFNRSHSACYAYTAYVCQYFKCHFPLEFWTVSLIFSKEEDISKKILEIENTGDINLFPPDINKSFTNYVANSETNSIYWSINSIKGCGEKSVDNIINERNENGLFKSFKDFIERVKGKRINKTQIKNFILCGCFDQIEKIEKITDRFVLINKFCEEEDKLEFSYINIVKEHFWLSKQKELCGIGNINFKKIYDESLNEIKFSKNSKYLDFDLIQDNDSVDDEVIVCGLINNIIERNTRKGKMGQLELDQNGKRLYITCWADFWETNGHLIKINHGSVLLMNGVIREDSYKKLNVIHSINSSKFKLV